LLLSHLDILSQKVRKCHDFLMSNAGFSKTRKRHIADCQADAVLKKFANGKSVFFEKGDLRKTLS